MNFFLYTIIFVMGTFFGSFFTLAVYRLPRKEDILIKHSYCPNCNHKLGFFDLFPVLSYLFLRGKCRYCQTKIRPRYLILEILSGLTFLLVAFTMEITVLKNFVNLIALLIYISILFIIAAIDKENIKIQKNILLIGYILELIYIIYQYTFGVYDVYQYVIYSLFFIIFLILDNIILRITMEEKYYIQILFLSLFMIIYSGSILFIMTVLCSLIVIAIYKIVTQKQNKKIPIGFILCVSHIIIIILFKLIINYIV